MASDKGNGLNLIFTDPYEALRHSISSSGKSMKEIAARVYPGTELDTAKSKLARALNPENHDVGLKIEIIQAIMDETTPEYFMLYLANKYNYKQPEKKPVRTPEIELASIKEIIKNHGLGQLFPGVEF